jgi:CheY-like chemotaxis protein
MRPWLVALSASALAHERQRYLESGLDDFVAKPVDFEHLGETLSRLPGVPFERETREPPDLPTAEGVVAGEVPLPRNLRLQLEQAARLYRTTELKQRLAEVEALGPGAAKLAVRLAVLNRAGKMQAIVELLRKTREES